MSTNPHETFDPYDIDNRPASPLYLHLARQAGRQCLNEKTNHEADLTHDVLSEQYSLCMKTLYDDLRFTDRDGIYSLQDIRDAISADLAALLNQREKTPYSGQLLIAPVLRTIGLEGVKGKPGIIRRFDAKQNPDAHTFVHKGFWLQQLPGAVTVPHQMTPLQWEVAWLVEGGGNMSPDQLASTGHKPGLAYANLSARDQRKAVADENQALTALLHEDQGTQRLVPADVTHLTVYKAIQRHVGTPPDLDTIIRLPQYRYSGLSDLSPLSPCISCGPSPANFRKLRMNLSIIDEGADPHTGTMRIIRILPPPA